MRRPRTAATPSLPRHARSQAVLSTYGFNSTLTLTMLQGIVTVVFLDLVKARGYITYPSFNWRTARSVAPLAFVFIAYVIVSLVSLGRVNVPMFTALRRCVRECGCWRGARPCHRHAALIPSLAG